MSWASRRRFIILLIIGAIAGALVTFFAFFTFTKAPSCTDGVQNQEESGIDCGGGCAYLCTDQQYPPTVLFTKALSNNEGRTDVIALLENKNANAAALNVPYRLTLFGSGQALIQEVTGFVDLPPGGTVPVYASGITSGKQTVTSAFLTIDSSSARWFTLSSTEVRTPRVLDMKQSGTSDTSRIEATLTNETTTPFTNTKVIVIVRDTNGTVIAASETLVPSIPAQDKATAFFTWNKAFSEVVGTIEVIPLPVLPQEQKEDA